MAVLDNAIWLTGSGGTAQNGSTVISDGVNNTTVTGSFTGSWDASQNGNNVSEFGAFGVTTPITANYAFSNVVENINFDFNHISDDGASTFDDLWTIRIYDENGVLVPSADVIAAFSGLVDEIVYANPDGSVSIEAQGTGTADVNFNLTGYQISAMELTFEAGPNGTQSGGSGISDISFDVPAPAGADGTVEGTTGNDTIDDTYTGDPDGDEIDNNDAILSGHAAQDDLVYAYGGNDTVVSGAGDDTVYGGSGSDSLSGGDGNDIIHGDDAPVPAETTILNWASQTDNGTAINDEDDVSGGFTGTTANGDINVAFSVQTEENFTGASMEETDALFNYNGLSDTSSIELFGGSSGTGQNASTVTLDFSSNDPANVAGEVMDVTFGIFDLDEFAGQFADQVIITAFDADGNPVAVTLTPGNSSTISVDNATGTATAISNSGGSGAVNSQTGFLEVHIDGPVAQIIIDYNNVDTAYGNHAIRVGDLQMSTIAVDPANSADVIDGGAGDDELYGGVGADTITGGAGADTMVGGADRDVFYGGVGDIVDGSESGDDVDELIIENVDYIDYDPTNSENGTAYFHGGGSMTFTNIETVTASFQDGTVEGTSGNDVIDGSYVGDPNGDIVDNNDAILAGHAGDDDLIYAYGGDDSVLAGNGNDTVYAGIGNDSVSGGSGNDEVYLGDGNDSFGDWSTDDGNDTIYGGGGSDSINAGNGDDTIFGGTGDDTLIGASGNDTLDGGTGTDAFWVTDDHDGSTIIGGEDLDNSDVDRVNFYNWESTQGVTVTATGEEAGTFDFDGTTGAGTFVEIEELQTTDYDDTVDMSLDGSGVIVSTFDGDDSIIGGSGDDLLFGGTGADTFNAGAGDDYIALGDNGAGSPDGDADVIILQDGFGNDIIGDFDAPTPNGDGTFTGIDTLDVSNLFDLPVGDPNRTPVLTNDVVVSDDGFGNAVLTFPNGETITLDGISPTDADNPFYLNAIGIPMPDGTVEGTAGADTIGAGYTGDPDGDLVDSNDAILPGDTGNDDLIYAYGGDDNIYSGSGNDEVYGGDGNDLVQSGGGNSTLYGGADNDTINSGSGNDTVFGGSGNDTINPSIGADDIYGGTGDDTISAGGFAGLGDTMRGEEGNDTIIGGSGNDTMYGGTGNDSFTVAAGGGTDVIEGGEDVGDGDVDTLTFEDFTGPDGVSITMTGDEAGTYEFPTAGGKGSFAEIEEIVLTDNNDVYDGTLATGGSTIDGGAGDDSLVGSSGQDDLSGGTGNDTLHGNGGDDNLYGGDGNDVVGGDAGNDTVYGGAGTDTLYGGADNDELYGGTGDDVIDGGSGDDTLTGGDGADTMTGGADQDVIYGGAGDVVDGSETGVDNDTLIVSDVDYIDYDSGNPENGTVYFNGGGTLVFTNIENVVVTDRDGTVSGTAGNDIIDGSYVDPNDTDSIDDTDAIIPGHGQNDDLIEAGAGNDQISAGSGSDTVYAGTGDDTVFGGGDGGNDTVFGEDGHDTVFGFGGDDVIYGGAGNDNLDGDDGNDTLDGGIGDDQLIGDGGTDTMFGGDGADTFYAGADNDTIYGGAGDDLAYGGDGNDTMELWLGNDTAFGGAGDDYIDGAQGNDELHGGEGNDTILAGSDDGDDTLYGGAGNDTLSAGEGEDTLYGGTGDDTQFGAGGDDTFVLEDNFGNDSITGGETDEIVGDTLDASAVISDLTVDLTTLQPSNPEMGTISDGTGTTTFSEIENIILGSGNDSVTGSSGNENIDLGSGADTINAGAGDDTINLGDNGAGSPDGDADLIVLQNGFGNDTIDNFDAPTPNGNGTYTGIDMLDVTALLDAGGDPVNVNDVVVSDDGSGNAVLTFPNGETLTLNGIDPTEADNPFYLNAIGIPMADGTVSGTAGNDVIDASYAGDPDGDFVDNNDAILPGDTGNDDLIEAGAGNDTVYAGLGNDEVYGGDGEDLILGGAGDDTLYGGNDDDELNLGTGNDTAFGGHGDDIFQVNDNSGTNTVVGGETGEDGNGDILNSNSSTPVIVTTSGDEAGQMTTGSTVVNFTEIEGIQTDSGDDVVDLSGDSSGMEVNTYQGNDSVTGGSGDDRVVAGEGDDTIDGGAGNDTIFGGSGADNITGGAGNDEMFGGTGSDAFVLGEGFGTDTIDAGEDVGPVDIDVVDAGGMTSDVTLNFTGDEAGTLSDGTNTATFSDVELFNLGSGNDTIIGGAGTEHVFAGAGDDSMTGGTGADTFYGGSGDDNITFADGDNVSGGSGDDTFTLEDLGETSNGTITVDGGAGDETTGDTLRLGDLATLQDVLDNAVDDGTGSYSGSITLDDGTILNFSEIENIICFTPTTRIATPKGLVAIENLKVGDMVVTRDHGLQPIRWIESRTVPAVDRFAPIRIRQNVLSGQDRDLIVSPQHRVLFQGYRAELLFGESEVLVSAKHLVDGMDVTQDESEKVTYIHMMFDQHEIVYAEGAATESFHPGDIGFSAVSDEAREELFSIFPELRSDQNHYGSTARRCLKKHEAKLILT